jgi:parvulin-like peptidyl-prolyl isomerase
MVPDSVVNVTDDDARQYYNSHPEEFRVKAGRKLQYITLSTAASHEDSSTVQDELQRLLGQAKSGVDFAEFATTYSETPQSEAYFKHGELGKVKENPLFLAKKGDVVGPIADNDGLHLFKILDERQGKDEFVQASHLILNHVPGPDSVKVIQKIRDIARRARSGEEFAKLARENGQDGTAPNGGELGWNGKGAWVKPFEDAAFNARVGSIVGPVRTQFGWHVIKVTGKDKREIKLARISMKIKASSKTTDGASQKAQDFSFLANDEGFEKAAQNSQIRTQETAEFTKGGVVPGIGSNDAVNNFAFQNKLGAISEPISISGGFGVFKVSGIRAEGARPFDDVKMISKAGATRLKKMEKLRVRAEKFRKSLSASTDLIAEAGSVSGVIAQKSNFKLTDFPPGVGRDPKFNGAAFALRPGEVSPLVEGQRGIYIIKLNAKTDLDTVRLAVERVSLRDQILNDRRSRFLNDWRTALRENAEIEDHRDKFYR